MYPPGGRTSPTSPSAKTRTRPTRGILITSAMFGSNCATAVSRSGAIRNLEPERRHSHLLDIPHQKGGRLDDALDVLAVGGHRHPLTGRQIGHHLEGAFLDCHSELFALVERRRLHPLDAQRLHL